MAIDYGMNVGEKCAQILLPKYLSRYGANENEIKQQVEKSISMQFLKVL